MNQASMFALLAAVVGTVGYHLVQRQVPATANPALVLTLVYLVGAIVCGLFVVTLFPIRSTETLQISGTVFALGAAVVLIEGGFLSMYRTGWSVGTGALIVNVLATVLLLGIAIVVFGERPTAFQIIGGAVCLIGLAIMNFQSWAA